MSLQIFLRDLFKVLIIIPLFFGLMSGTGLLLAAARRKRAGDHSPWSLKAEMPRILANKRLTFFFSAIALFAIIYAVKTIALRLVLALAYIVIILRIFKVDDGRT